MSTAIAYVSSLILFATIVHEIREQWRAEGEPTVSPWLFVGQLIASLGFTWYSVDQDDLVFILTNGLLSAAALVGLGIVLYRRRRPRDGTPAATSSGRGRGRKSEACDATAAE